MKDISIQVLEGSLSSDLASSHEYQAGAELSFALHFSTLRAGGFYLLGALYSSEGVYLPGTLFGIIEDDNSNGVTSFTHARLWSLTEGEEILLPCRFTFDRTGMVLGLFFMKMTGEAINPEEDTVVGQLAISLVVPASPIQVIAGVTPALILLTGMAAIMMGVYHD